MSGERRLQWTAVDCQDHAAGLDIASITFQCMVNSLSSGWGGHGS